MTTNQRGHVAEEHKSQDGERECGCECRFLVWCNTKTACTTARPAALSAKGFVSFRLLSLLRLDWLTSILGAPGTVWMYSCNFHSHLYCCSFLLPCVIMAVRSFLLPDGLKSFKQEGNSISAHSCLLLTLTSSWHQLVWTTIQDRTDLRSSLANLNGGTAWAAPTSRWTWITVTEKQYQAFMQRTQTHNLFYRSPITNHFQKWQLSRHAVTLVAFSHWCLGGSASRRITGFCTRSLGCLVRRGTSQAFRENKKPFSWLFTDDLQRISERFEHRWAEQLPRIQIPGCKPCSFHQLCFEKCRTEACPKLELSIKGTVKGKPCLISIPQLALWKPIL